jgi:hemerythrin superfamily protein
MPILSSKEHAMAQLDISEPAEAAPDAIDLLTRDHRLVDDLFASFEQAAPQQLDPLARRLCKLVRIHAQIEQELFYPVVRRIAACADFVDEAEHDHSDARNSIIRIESMTSDDPQFRETLDMLREQIAAHVASEESELFPQVRKARIDLAALGVSLTERRDTLMEVLGLHADDEDGAANMRDVQRPVDGGRRTADSDKRD